MPMHNLRNSLVKLATCFMLRRMHGHVVSEFEQ